MSTIFRKALEKHMAQVKTRLTNANPGHINEELKATQHLLTLVTDGRRRRALENAIKQLEAARRDAGNSEDLKKVYTAMENLHTMIRHRPEYNLVRKSRGEKKK